MPLLLLVVLFLFADSAPAGPVDGAGTPGTIPKWQSVDTLVDSVITETATTITASRNFVITGHFTMAKVTTGGTAAGAGNLRIEAVCGTNSGTAKIIIYAGTSTLPSTLLDNIGSGVSGC